MGSTWGNNLKISIFGESHGQGIGAVIDGFPAGMVLDMEFILKEMERRAPGRNSLTTSRKEKDQPSILSGILENKTTGAPLCVLIENTDTRSRDYEELKVLPRPGHSDYTASVRYDSANDVRGGGHFSGRLTAPLVFAGALCKLYLKEEKGVEIGSHLLRIGTVCDDRFDGTGISEGVLAALRNMATPVLSEEAAGLMEAEIARAAAGQDSVGGIVECAVCGVSAGLGSPMFDNIESRLASILYGIPAVKGVSFGDGFDLAAARGLEVNDCYEKIGGRILTKTNHCGGILGGITTGMPIIVQAAIKPTPSVSAPQATLNLVTGKEEILRVKGRHDPCVALRAPAAVEAAVAVAMMDLYLEADGYVTK